MNEVHQHPLYRVAWAINSPPTNMAAKKKTAAKKAVSKKTGRPAPKGRGYTDVEKENVLAFVDEHNAECGRGGITAATKRFGVTSLTISAWKNKRDSGAPQMTLPTVENDMDFGLNIQKIQRIRKQMQELQERMSKDTIKLGELKVEYGDLKKLL